MIIVEVQQYIEYLPSRVIAGKTSDSLSATRFDFKNKETW